MASMQLNKPDQQGTVSTLEAHLMLSVPGGLAEALENAPTVLLMGTCPS